MRCDKEENVYYLYWIHRENHSDMRRDGYIGVTFNPERRFIQHKSNANRDYEQHLYRAIRKYNDIKYDVICIGDMSYILEIENKLRPNINIGGNIATGGKDTGLGYLKSKESIIKQAESMTNFSRLTALNVFIDYFEKAMSRKSICKKYDLGQWTVWSIITGNSKAYPDLEYVRRSIISDRKFNSSHPGSLPEKLYDNILTLREGGKTYPELEKIFKIPDRTIREYCKGNLKYLKKFSCYRKIK